jgi:hypothetical protein
VLLRPFSFRIEAETPAIADDARAAVGADGLLAGGIRGHAADRRIACFGARAGAFTALRTAIALVGIEAFAGLALCTTAAVR